MYKLGSEKAEELDIKLSTFVGSWRKQGNSRRTSTSASVTILKPLTVWITTNCGKFLKRWEYQTTLPVSCETLCGSRSKVRTGFGTMEWFKFGKGVHQGCISSPCLFNFYTQNNMGYIGLNESQARIKIVGRNISC